MGDRLDTPYDIVHEGEVASTQDVSVDVFGRSGRAVLVIADRQVEGRGRQGRAWVEPDRGMFSSFTYATTWPIESRTLIPLTAAVAVRRAVASVAGVTLDAKWPNDLMSAGRKVGGLLVEATDDRVTVGCGVNLWWRDPPDYAAAVFHDDPGPEAATDLARAWVDEFRALTEPGPESWPRSEYEAACVTLQAQVRWDDGEGLAVGVAANGGLVVETASGLVTVEHGDVHLTARG